MTEIVDLSPAVLNLVLYAGDGEDFQISFIDKDTKEPIDVSYLTWQAQIRQRRTSDESFSLEITTDDAESGIILIHVSSEVTRNLPKKGQWDLQSIPSEGDEPITILQGSVVCNMDVTREDVSP
jgi:hypothetical protein